MRSLVGYDDSNCDNTPSSVVQCVPHSLYIVVVVVVVVVSFEDLSLIVGNGPILAVAVICIMHVCLFI